MKTFATTFKIDFLQFNLVFGAFGVVCVLLQSSLFSETRHLMIILSTLALNLSVLISIVYFGDAMMREATRTKVLVIKVIHHLRFVPKQKYDLCLLMTQLQIRNLDFQNEFFKINWNILSTVSIV